MATQTFQKGGAQPQLDNDLSNGQTTLKYSGGPDSKITLERHVGQDAFVASRRDIADHLDANDRTALAGIVERLQASMAAAGDDDGVVWGVV